MWQCDNCGYTDEDGTTFEEETEEGMEEPVRYCPECGSDEVFLVDDEDDEDEADEEEAPARVEDVAEWEADEDANASEDW